SMPLHLPRPPRRCAFFFRRNGDPRVLPSFPTRRSSDLKKAAKAKRRSAAPARAKSKRVSGKRAARTARRPAKVKPSVKRAARKRSEEHTSELQSRENLVCRLLLEKKNEGTQRTTTRELQ